MLSIFKTLPVLKFTEDVPLVSVNCNFLMGILKTNSLQTELPNARNRGQVTILKKNKETGKSQYTVVIPTSKY